MPVWASKPAQADKGEGPGLLFSMPTPTLSLICIMHAAFVACHSHKERQCMDYISGAWQFLLAQAFCDPMRPPPLGVSPHLHRAASICAMASTQGCQRGAGCCYPIAR